MTVPGLPNSLSRAHHSQALQSLHKAFLQLPPETLWSAPQISKPGVCVLGKVLAKHYAYPAQQGAHSSSVQATKFSSYGSALRDELPQNKGSSQPKPPQPVSSPVCSNTLKTLCPFTRYSNVSIQADTVLITSHITTYFYFSAPSLAVSSQLGGLVWGTKPLKKINSLSCCSVLSAGLAP